MTSRVRAQGFDALRGLAVIAMFAVHVRRLQAPRHATLADRVLEALGAGEPLISATFVALAGYSLVLGEPSWARVARRAVVLYALGVGLFVLQYGLAWPDVLLSPGVLSVIAVGIVLTRAALAARSPSAALGALGAALVGVTQLLEARGLGVSGLLAGPGGALPLVACATSGALVARLTSRPAVAGLCVASLALSALALATRAPWTTSWPSWHPRVSGATAALALLHPQALLAAPRVAVWFWNHSAVGVLGLAAPLTALLLGARALRVSLDPLALLGRHALAAYVGHLVLLGLIDVAGLGPGSAGASWALVAVLAAVFSSLAFGLERRQRDAKRRVLELRP